MTNKNIYAKKALSQIPHLLTCLDRNPFSPTYGCFNREYWLTRTRDFPDAIAQFGTLSLALIWAHRYPGGEQYYRNPEVKKWALAGISYWMKIQHRDGSFDEFYPNERGWAGPTGFLLYAMLRSYELLGDEFPQDMKDGFLAAVKKSAWFLATREEPGVLANHHAMALLPIYQAHYHLKNIDGLFSQELLGKFNERLDSFFSYCNDEGWCLEYDGADPGYLSATVSFLSKMQKYLGGRETWREKISQIITKGIQFSSYFFYPNGSYGGTLGSRQTLHFYAHGYELQGSSNPLAAACAAYGRNSLAEGKLVSPEIQDDRYYVYRIPEFLEAYIDAVDQTPQMASIPCERQEEFEKFFPQAKILIKNTPDHYLLISLAKGGVVKVYDKKSKKLVFSDDGIVAELANGQIFTTQWIGNEYQISAKNGEYSVTGNFHKVPYQYFTPLKMILFRIFNILTGWNAKSAELTKGLIRNLLMTKTPKGQLTFSRKFRLDKKILTITTHIDSRVKIASLRIGGQFATRYVPQSRYFQQEELDNYYWQMKNSDQLSKAFEISFGFSTNEAIFMSLKN